MPDLAYGDLVRSSRTNTTSKTNALAVIPIASDYAGIKLNKPYCTISDLKEYIGNSELDDGFYAQSINQASRMVETITGKNFWYSDFRFVDYKPKKEDIFEYKIFLPFPIRSIISLIIEDNIVDKNKYDFIPITDYNDPRNFYIEAVTDSQISKFGSVDSQPKYVVNERTLAVKIRGEFGYKVKDTLSIPTDANFPPDVRRATTMIAGTLTGKFMKQSLDLDGNRQNILETMIPHDAVKLLKKSKRIIL